MPHVANISTQKAKACEDPRIPRSHKVSHGKESPPSPSRKGAKKPCGQRIIPSLADFYMSKKPIRISRDVFSSLPRPTTSASSPLVTIRVFPLQEAIGVTAFLVTISKKEISTAVKRNLIRRRYKEAITKMVTSLPQGVVIQCIVKRPASTKSFQDISDDLRGLIQKLRP